MAASDSHLKSDDGQMSQQTQPMESQEPLGECRVTVEENRFRSSSVNGKEAQGECSVTVEESWDFNPFQSPSVVSIYRVPDILKSDRVKREAYVPTRVSLGPYHHETEKLRSMNSHKKKALQRTMRFNNLANDSLCATKEIVKIRDTRDIYEEKINCDEEQIAMMLTLDIVKIRDIYEEKINCDKKQIAMMLTLDGCFILEILRTLKGDRLPEDGNCYEPLFEKERILNTGMDILYDMLKLENQIPFIVLLKLLKLELNSMDIDAENKLFQMMHESFLPLFYPFESKLPKERRWSWPQPHHHLLDWLRICILSLPSDNGDDMLNGDIAHSHNGEQRSWPQPHHQHEVHHLLGWLRIFIIYGDGMLHGDIAHSHNGEHARNGHSHNEEHARNGHSHNEEHARNGYMKIPEDSGTYDHIHPAIELENAGIKFERFDGGIANIKYDKSRNTICLPRITIKDSSEILFRNLIAFEMCKPSHPFNYVACYVRLMDQLIDSEEDVALLRKRKIITNHLGSDEEVAKLFNGLCKGVNVNLQGAFDGLTEKVHNHYNNKFRVQLAELVKEYFSSPWKTLGLLGGIALLLLSIVQTVVAILALYK